MKMTYYTNLSVSDDKDYIVSQLPEYVYSEMIGDDLSRDSHELTHLMCKYSCLLCSRSKLKTLSLDLETECDIEGDCFLEPYEFYEKKENN